MHQFTKVNRYRVITTLYSSAISEFLIYVFHSKLWISEILSSKVCLNDGNSSPLKNWGNFISNFGYNWKLNFIHFSKKKVVALRVAVIRIAKFSLFSNKNVVRISAPRMRRLHPEYHVRISELIFVCISIDVKICPVSKTNFSLYLISNFT